MPAILREFQDDPASNICGCLVMMGSNDSTKSSNALQHVPLERFKLNMNWILDYLIEFGIDRQRLIVISPPRISDAKWAQEVMEKYQDVSTHLDGLVKDYARVCIEVAEQKELANFDLNGAMHTELSQDSLGEYLYDGLHLSKRGGEFLFERLEPLISQRIANRLEFQLPYWKDIEREKMTP